MLRQGISLCAVLFIAACMKKAAEPPTPTTDSSPSSSYAPSDTMHQTGADTISATPSDAVPSDAVPSESDTMSTDASGDTASDEPMDSDTTSDSESDSLSMPQPDSTWTTSSSSTASTAVPDTQAPPKVDPLLADRGSRIWNSKQCAGCHELGREQSTGPNLIGVTDRRTADWLERYLQDPVAMTSLDETAKALKKQYNSQMPKFGLSKDDADALINYLAQETQRHAK
jgi:mono/diheme cytochrome c family protein